MLYWLFLATIFEISTLISTWENAAWIQFVCFELSCCSKDNLELVMVWFI